METEKYIIVNEKDEPIGNKELEEITPNDIYRVSALWIENSKGEVLLARRSLNKKNDPGKWGPAVAGTVEVGEDYESNIYKEAEEEIGLKSKKFQKFRKVRNHGKHNYFCQWYYLQIDKPIDYFKIQEEEVEEIAWFPKDELEKEFKNNPEKFLISFGKNLEYFKDLK